jgi:hypothetical protein
VDEAKLKAEWEKRSGIADRGLLDEVWKDLKDDYRVREALGVGERGVEDLLDATRPLRKYYRLGQGRKPPPVSREKATVEIELGEGEREHAEALSIYLAKQAVLWPEVRGFRDKVLDGALLSPDDPGPVRDFLGNELDPEYDLPRIAPAYHPELLTDTLELKDLVAGGVDPDASAVYPYHLPDYPLLGGDVIDHLSAAAEYRYPYEAGVMELISDGEGRSLGDLGRRLAAHYPWKPGEGAWFVLTGESPEIEPLRLYYDETRGTFTLAFMPWVSKGTILQVRRLAQQHSGSGALRDKALEVFRFVAERTDTEENRRWEQLRAEWNKQHPDVRFENRSSIASAYRRAEEKLAGSWTGAASDAPTSVTASIDLWEGS